MASLPTYDVTSHLIPHWDAHLSLAVVEWLGGDEDHPPLYEPDSVQQSLLQIVANRTRMHEEHKNLLQDLGKIPESAKFPKAIAKLRKADEKQADALRAKCKPLLDLVLNTEEVERLKKNKDFTLERLESMGIDLDCVRSGYELAQLLYSRGHYLPQEEDDDDADDEAAAAAEPKPNSAETLIGAVLDAVRLVDSENALAALWGKLALQLGGATRGAAAQTLNELLEAVDALSDTEDAALQLQNRVWLLHWSLFVFFPVPGGRAQLLNFWIKDSFLSALDAAPHLMRYLAAAAIEVHHRRSTVNDVGQVLAISKAMFSDPVTEMLVAFVVDLDLEAGLAHLHTLPAVCQQDFFLSMVSDEVLNSAKELYLVTCCSLFHEFSADTVAADLQLAGSSDEQRRWISDHLSLRSKSREAAIDLETGVVTVSFQPPTTYERVTERIQQIHDRSAQLMGFAEHRYQNTAARAQASAAGGH